MLCFWKKRYFHHIFNWALNNYEAYVPEEDLIEFVVGKFRSECNRWLAGLAKKFDVMMENEQERLGIIKFLLFIE